MPCSQELWGECYPATLQMRARRGAHQCCCGRGEDSPPCCCCLCVVIKGSRVILEPLVMRGGRARAEMHWMCCTVTFSTGKSKQSHLLALSLVSLFHSTQKVQQQEKGHIFQEIQALRRSGASSDAVSPCRETSDAAHALWITTVCFVKSRGGFRPGSSHPDVAACASLQRLFGT